MNLKIFSNTNRDISLIVKFNWFRDLRPLEPSCRSDGASRRRHLGGIRRASAPASAPRAPPAWAFVPGRRSWRAFPYSWRAVGGRRPWIRNGGSPPRPASAPSREKEIVAERCRRARVVGTRRTSSRWLSPSRRRRGSPGEFVDGRARI